MFIVGRKGVNIYNADKIHSISIDVDTIIAHMENGVSCLGIYTTRERAEEVFHDIINALALGNTIFHMPEE